MQESLAPAMSDVGLLLLALDEKFNNTGLLHRIDLRVDGVFYRIESLNSFLSSLKLRFLFLNFSFNKLNQMKIFDFHTELLCKRKSCQILSSFNNLLFPSF